LGGRGFLGKAIAGKLKSKCNVYTFDRKDGPANHIKGTILNKDDLLRAFGGKDIVINLVGLTPLRKPKNTSYEDVHVSGVRNIVEACKDNNKKLSLSSQLPMVEGLYSDFSQVFCNLIKNAADSMFGRPVKNLTITTEYLDDRLIIGFEDTGHGIPEHILEKIFDPFFSTKAEREISEQDEPVGTGLGLYTCYEIIKSYGGLIETDSRVGSGTVFRIILSVREGEGIVGKS